MDKVVTFELGWNNLNMHSESLLCQYMLLILPTSYMTNRMHIAIYVLSSEVREDSDQKEQDTENASQIDNRANAIVLLLLFGSRGAILCNITPRQLSMYSLQHRESRESRWGLTATIVKSVKWLQWQVASSLSSWTSEQPSVDHAPNPLSRDWSQKEHSTLRPLCAN